MKVGRLIGPGQLRLVEEPEPSAGPGEIVVELAACGVCGTDLEKLRGNYQTTGKLGHEPVGVVRLVGAEVKSAKAGDRVFVHHHVPCYRCEVCRRGDFTFCPEYSKSNIDPGGFAERFRVPRENVERGAVLRLDPRVTWEIGSLIEPAACALTALHRIGFTKGQRLFVVGLGPVGVLYARVARALGASWIGGAEVSKTRRERAGRRGFDLVVDPQATESVLEQVRGSTGGDLVDAGVAATGAPAAVRLAGQVVRRGGTLNLFGLPEPGSRLDLDLQQLYLAGIRVVPTYATVEPDVAEIHRLWTAGQLDLSEVVTHQVPLDQLPRAFELAGDPETALKVIVLGPANS